MRAAPVSVPAAPMLRIRRKSSSEKVSSIAWLRHVRMFPCIQRKIGLLVRHVSLRPDHTHHDPKAGQGRLRQGRLRNSDNETMDSNQEIAMGAPSPELCNLWLARAFN